MNTSSSDRLGARNSFRPCDVSLSSRNELPGEKKWGRVISASLRFHIPRLYTMHKGVHDRGYLPHWDFESSVQAITFRFADALPKHVVEKWKKELAIPDTPAETDISRKGRIELARRIARYEDAGHGACLLAKHECARIVQDGLLADHGGTYELIEWCIMPNHVHVLIRMIDDAPLGTIVKAWKASSAVRINRLIGQAGSLWLPDYHDRFIRDLDHFHNAVAYIRNNPVKAGLCRKPSEWSFSSAGFGWSTRSDQPTDEDRAE